MANGTPAQSNVYLLDGAYNNDDRLGGSQGTQVRLVLDNIGEYQVLSNSYSAEYGGGAGAVINMVSRGGTNDFSGRVYTYFRDDKFNARGPLPPRRRGEAAGADAADAAPALGGPIVKNRAHFYLTIEKDNEDIAGQKTFPAAAAPLATDFVGAFEVRAMNYFGRVDVQLNPSNFLSIRAVREKAPTRGEGFNTNNETPDAQNWEEDLDELLAMSVTSTISDRASNVFRVGAHPRAAQHRRAGLLRRRRQCHRVRRPRPVLDRAGEHPPQLRHRHRRQRLADHDPDLHLRRRVQLLRAQPVGRRAHVQGRRRHRAGTRRTRRQFQFSGIFDFASDLPVRPGQPGHLPPPVRHHPRADGRGRLRLRGQGPAELCVRRGQVAREQEAHPEPRPAL